MTPKKTIPTYDPDTNNNFSSYFSSNGIDKPLDSFDKKTKKNIFSPALLAGLVGIMGLAFLFSSGATQQKEQCRETIGINGEKVVNCTTYGSNGILGTTSYPYIFWMNNMGRNYTNNNGIYERVWSVRNGYTRFPSINLGSSNGSYSTYSNTTSTTTKKSSLGSSGKSYGGSSG